MTPTPLDSLRQIFGYSNFRQYQSEIISTLIRGEDAFVLMPTGGGKSLCYQIPALHRPGIGIVVSPLISLMKDQVDALRENGVRAAYYNSSLNAGEARDVLRRLHTNDLDLLYIAPERLMSHDFLERLNDVQIALFAIDEAHCVSQWGHDFRPEYMQLGRLRALFPKIPLIALTATAESQTKSDIQERLNLQKAHSYIAGFDRPNIRYTVVDKRKPKEQLLAFLRGRHEQSGIVYCLSRKRVEQVAAHLSKSGFSSAAYHAGLPADERKRVQNDFLKDNLQVVVATVAFGMGIDKPNVRFVVHYDLPKTIESYYQETGRAGRDGLPSEALLLFGYGDIAVARGLIESNRNQDQKRIEIHKLNSMVAFTEAQSCRRNVLLGYFGEHHQKPCGNCDICLDPPELHDVTEEARKALSCVYRVGQRFGMMHVIDVLRGSQNERIRRLQHERLSTYGIGKDQPKEFWTSLMHNLVHHGFLFQDVAEYSILKLTETARPLLRGEQQFTMAKPRARVSSAKKKSPKNTAALDYNEELFEKLRVLRKELADAGGVPPFVVFGDKSLIEMAAHLPSDDEEFLYIHGVGANKLNKYGPAFLQAIADFKK
ncbi:MAG: DNA helicase RecQ [Desulfobulbaceae bacterium]|uniref:DNA helicase RecQ n=1 Tax=Candidatus Desulfatifera sulfidica TaxID=2841691 RepID=A0A8J6N593_9BACT|nr:DNA helicase RecQ [Candidatus Desulfatifera sulfidica]